MFFYEEKIGQTIKILNEQREERIYELPLVYTECGYKESNALPKVTDEWKPVDNNLCFVGLNRHFWIHTSLKTPPKKDGCRVALKINRDKSNLQCLVYLNGKLGNGFPEHILKLTAKTAEFLLIVRASDVCFALIPYNTF